MESISSSMGFFQPMNSEDFASNFSSACEEQYHLPRRVETGGTESPLFIGKLGRYAQVSSPKPSGFLKTLFFGKNIKPYAVEGCTLCACLL